MNARQFSVFFTVTALLIAAPLTRAAQVEIEWVEPEKFTDILDDGGYSPKYAERVINQLSDTFEKQAEATLPEGYLVQLTVTDVDLTGISNPGAFGRSPRVIRNGFPPGRIVLTYQVTDASGTIVAEGEDHIRTQRTVEFTRFKNAEFAFEQDAIRRWIQRLNREV